MTEQFKFGSFVRRKYSHTIGIATIVDDTHCYIAWPSGNSDWHEKDDLIPVSHPDSVRLEYMGRLVAESMGMKYDAVEHRRRFDARLGWMAAKEHTAEQGGWISVQNSLPTKSQEVLVFKPISSIEISYYCERRKEFLIPDTFHTMNQSLITHWQPLPAPPEKE